MHVSVKRRVPYCDEWEPFFIATHDLPMFEERLSWEGMKDKQTLVIRGGKTHAERFAHEDLLPFQGYYQLCLMNRDFVVLDNAFIVPRSTGAMVKTRDTYTSADRKASALKQVGFDETQRNDAKMQRLSFPGRENRKCRRTRVSRPLWNRSWLHEKKTSGTFWKR